MSGLKRDDFSKPIIDALAKRAGYLCSNPNCRILTVGSNSVDSKATIIGEAAHITAAASGGPRYSEILSSEERSDISNGIWLCSKCATLIDKDPGNYPTPILYEWKGGVEAETKIKLRGGFKVNEPQLNESAIKRPILEVDFAGGGRGRANKGYSLKNPQEIYEGQPVLVVGSEPIIFWGVHWRYQMVIYNNSSYPAYNVRIENVKQFQFSEFGQLSKINNIPPLDKIELTVRYEDVIEGIWSEADVLLKPRYPLNFNNNLVLKLTYQSEDRKTYETIIEFKDGELINKL